MKFKAASLFLSAILGCAGMAAAIEPSPNGASSTVATNSTPPADALRRLLDGNYRFANAQVAHPHQTQERRQAVAAGQNPIAVVLTCADSRVAPELLFDQGIGDLFVIRNAGNVLDDHVLGSIEYAVEHLHVQLVVVLGHSSCGAAKATLQGGTAPGHVASIVASLKPVLETSNSKAGDKLTNLIRENAVSGASAIEKSEPILSAAVAEGQLRVVSAGYDLETGKVTIFTNSSEKTQASN